jgi:anti-anti-sigma factor
MQVKIDTRANFHAITIKEPALAANMTEELDESLLPLLHNDVKNIVLNLSDIENIDNAAAESLIKTQQAFYEQNASFVVWGLSNSVERSLDDFGLLQTLNAAPTEAEAIDILQMEEIERELLSDED